MHLLLTPSPASQRVKTMRVFVLRRRAVNLKGQRIVEHRRLSSDIIEPTAFETLKYPIGAIVQRLSKRRDIFKRCRPNV